MKKRYSQARLSARERAFLELVLLEELDMQSWFAVLCSSLVSEEFVICIQ
jgi:hypothetical protein